MKKFDNGLVNFVIGIVKLEKLYHESQYDDCENDNLFCSIMYCHALSLLDAYIGDRVRYAAAEMGSKDTYEYQSFLNISSKIVRDIINKVLGINIDIPNNFSEIVKKRNSIIHRNGLNEKGQHCKVTREEVKEILYLIRDLAYQVNDKIIDKQVEKLSD